MLLKDWKVLVYFGLAFCAITLIFLGIAIGVAFNTSANVVSLIVSILGAVGAVAAASAAYLAIWNANRLEESRRKVQEGSLIMGIQFTSDDVLFSVTNTGRVEKQLHELTLCPSRLGLGVSVINDDEAVPIELKPFVKKSFSYPLERLRQHNGIGLILSMAKNMEKHKGSDQLTLMAFTDIDKRVFQEFPAEKFAQYINA